MDRKRSLAGSLAMVLAFALAFPALAATPADDLEAKAEAACRAALWRLVEDLILPDGQTLPGIGAGSEFAMFRVGGRPKLGLRILLTDEPMWEGERIYGYDAATGTFMEELWAPIGVEHYDSGAASVSYLGAGAGGTFLVGWYRFDETTGKYEDVGASDEWHEDAWPELAGRPFPDELDEDGDGILFFVSHGPGRHGEGLDLDHPVDGAAFRAWREEIVGEGASTIDIEWRDYTEILDLER